MPLSLSPFETASAASVLPSSLDAMLCQFRFEMPPGIVSVQLAPKSDEVQMLPS